MESLRATNNDDAFVHLHVHTEYSLLDGAMKIPNLCEQAAAQGAKHLAITDHGVMLGALEHYEYCKKNGLNPIIGVEAYIAPVSRFEKTKRNECHVTLLAMNAEGYHNLAKLVSIGFTEGYYYKPRIDMEVLAQYNAGIICLSGCLSGLVQEPLQHGNYDAARDAALAYKSVFGDRFYLEIMRHGLDDQNKVEAAMLLLAADIDVPLVATNDCHYLNHDDHDFHDLLLCVGTGAKLADEKRFHFHGDQFYLKTPAEMREIFRDIPEACDNTLAIAERISIDLTTTGFHILEYPVPPEKNATPAQYLRALALGGLRKRYGIERVRSDATLRERLEYELKIIEDMGFSSYFLIVWDFIKYARDNDIPVGPGRGSAVGSLVSYCLAITALDPLRFKLYFERFLNPSRISMPDIDTDFCIDGRDRVIRYVKEKYGNDRVSGIVTFNTIAARGSVRDAARVLGIELPIADKLAKLIPSGPKGLTIKEARVQIPQIAQLEQSEPTIRRLMEMAERIEGFVRQLGTHAAGIVIADADLTKYLPLVTIEKGGSKTLNTQYEMKWIEQLGLIKMDFLGLRNLTLMRAAEKEIRRTVRPDFVLAEIPDDDKATFDMIARGETTGVFQLESDGMRDMLMRMGPNQLEDIIAAVALYRPGPMEWIPQYIDGKQGRITPEYLHPKLEPILSETYGVAIYQEQIMEMARAIAGYDMAQADNLRKVMGKKQKEKIKDEGIAFVKNAVANGVDEHTASEIFKFIEPFAGYGFNKSHAAAYGWISYQTAYLSANYPMQYLAALMTSIDKTDKLVEYIEETRRRGIKVLPPDVNASQSTFALDDKAIRFGLRSIKGMQETSLDGILAERENGGAFRSIFDLVNRTRIRNVARATVETLIKVGACDNLPGHRAQKVAALEHAFNRANREIEDALSGQMNFFGGAAVEEKPGDLLPNVPRASRIEELNWERDGLGIFVSGHPVDSVAHHVKRRRAITVIDAKKLGENTTTVIVGMVGVIKRIVTKAGGKNMLVCGFEDRTGSIELVVYSGQYDIYHELFVEGAILAVNGLIRTRQQINNDDDDNAQRTMVLNQADEVLRAGFGHNDLETDAVA